jgi:hypothetical protein
MVQKKNEKKEIEIRNRNRKKEKSPSVGPFPAQSFSLLRAPALPPPRAAQAAHLPRARTPSQPLSLWQAGPACQHLPRAHDQANDAITAGRHRPSSRH